MRRYYFFGAFGLLGLVGLALALSGCGKGGDNSGGGALPRISAGGATFPEPLITKWAGEYKNNAKKGEVDYVASGSGAGITAVTQKTMDFACSDAPMTAKELDAAKAAGGDVLHVPVTIGAVVLVYNLEGVKDLKLSGDVVAEIYLKKVTKWNDPKIATLNPGVALPDKDILPVCRDKSSGTTFIFTEYLSKKSEEFAKGPGTSKMPTWPKGLAAKTENAGIAKFVKETPYTIGYVELAFAKTNDISYASIKNIAARYVAPDPASVTAAVEAAMKVKQAKEPYSLHALTFSFTDADGENSYPIVGASYAMLFKKQPKDKGPPVVDFLKWAVNDGQKFATELHYAPLPAELTKKAQELLGTVTFE